MKKLTLKPAAFAAALASAALAGPPVQDMSSTSIGVDYSGTWRGEKITERNVPAHESMHHINVRYAPLPYVLLSAGFGAANFGVDTCNQVQFKGGFNFSPSLGFSLFTPSFFNKKVRVTAGVKSHYLYTRNSDESYLYYGPVVVPNAGLIVSLGDYLDLEAGARGLLLFGHMQPGSRSAQVFSNGQQKRTYFSIMLHTPAEGAYMLVDFDASNGMDMNWSNGPAESSIGFTVGVIIRQSKDRLASKIKDNTDYPGYREMENKIEEMEKNLQ
jgi:hypothetical protein